MLIIKRKKMKRAIIFVLNTLLLTVFGVLLRTVIMGKVALYISYITDYGDYYPLKSDFALFIVASLFLLLLYTLLFHVFLKKNSLLIRALATGTTGVLVAYLFGAFFNGFTITFRLTSESIKSLTPIFIIGFIIPYIDKWLSRMLNYHGK